MQITENELQLVSYLKHEPGYILLCDHLQALVDDMADDMSEGHPPSDILLQKLAEWKSARYILTILKTYPESLARELKDRRGENKDAQPSELTMDEGYLTRMRSASRISNPTP